MPLPTPWLAVAGAVLCVVFGFAGGYVLKDRLAESEIARLKAAHAAEQQAAAEDAVRRLAAAQKAEHSALRALRETRARLDATNQRLKEALYGLPTSSNCGLSFGTFSVLDRAIMASDDLPKDTAEPAGAAAGSAADPARPAASEAAVGGWIADAVRRYDECRARIDAIRQWDDEVSGVKHGR